MKQILLSFILLLAVTTISHAQDRSVARGAAPGELYLTGAWYGIYDPYWGPPFYDTLRTAIYHITENGKKLTIQYDADYFADIYTEPGSVMQPDYILADATPGVIYNKCNYSKNSYAYTALWVSFDYGKNWMFREENMGSIGYFNAGLYDSVLYKGGEDRSVLQSRNFGESFIFLFTVPIPYSIGEYSYKQCEFLGIGSFYNKELHYTGDCANSFTIIPIDNQFMFGQMGGIYPDLFRGGKEGEVYVSSMFPEPDYYVTYKVSFSTDTGYTFRHVFVSESLAGETIAPLFMSDREPGIFYIIRRYQVEDFNPWGWHWKICVEYYRDYGDTHVATYCHDINKNYENEIGIKEVENDVAIFPNPTTGELHISHVSHLISHIEIYDIYGRKQKAESRKQDEIDISELEAGVYFIRIQTEKGIITKKIIKY